MQRRGGSGQPVKGRRDGTGRPKTRKARVASASADRSAEQFDRLKSERDEAQEQQAATAELLRVIRRSPTDVQPVFDMVAESASRLCAAQFCFVYRFDGQLLHFVAHHSVTPEVVEVNRRAYPQPPSRASVAARAILEQSVVQIPDVNADPDYALGELATACGYRSAIGIPILRDGVPVGSIAIARAQAGLFPNRQIELLKTFADQAVIAIENTRLLSELRESLQQQTATADVLKVISSSPGQLEPVFNSMLENATRICGARFGTMFHFDGKRFDFAANHGTPPALVELQKRRGPFLPEPGGVLDRVLLTKQVAHSADYAAEQPQAPPVAVGGARSTVAVPMLKDDELVGAIVIYRQEVRPFSDREVDLVRNFGAQAVIAIENTRLLNELRQRTNDLTESLEQQTATSEVLKVISSSPGELEPVFEAMLENATRICDAGFGGLFKIENGQFEPVAYHNLPEALERHLTARGRIKPRPGSTMERVMQTKDVVHVVDLWQDADGPENPASKYGNARTLLGVPMLKDDELIGAIAIYRKEVRPFTDKQVELVQNFAAQAVIAIENTRLLNELRESLQQQTATADVLKVISTSPGELEPVFQAMLENATRICDAKFGNIYRWDGDSLR